MREWQREIRHALKTSRELASFLEINSIEETDYPLFIPKKFAALIKKKGQNSALWRQFVPSSKERENSGMTDPIGDQVHAKGGQLIHRYPSRALFLPTTRCPIVCRYCFRKNELYDQDLNVFTPEFEKTLNYLKSHPEIVEIIYSGGDPLMLSEGKLIEQAKAFSEVGIKFLRFHTRFPVILPERIDDIFIEFLKEITSYFESVSLAIHINHPEEITKEFVERITPLRSLPVHLFSQTVLLKGVNDSTSILTELFLGLSCTGIIPYYLHHPDKAQGTDHFQLSLEEGQKICQGLRGNLPGWALPRYILDLPGGKSKVEAISGNYLASKNGHVFKTFKDQEVFY